MNIAIFPSAFHPHFGGVEELARQLAHQLMRSGHAPCIFTNRWPKSLPAFEDFEGLPVHRHTFRVPERDWRQLLTSLLFTGATLRSLEGRLHARRPDVIHLQCVSSNSYYAVRMRRRLKLPFVVTLQGELTMDAGGLFQKSKFAQGLLRSALDEAHVITACSGKTLADAEEFYGHPFGERGRVIFNAARLDDFEAATPYRHQRPYIFALGRVVPQKGFDVLLKAFAGSDAHDHDLLIAGEGSELDSLRQMAAGIGIQDRVHFLGRANREQVPSLFRGASFFVLPSRTDEGLPVVCSEAMAAGKAILATRSGGVPEAVLDGKTGIVVERGDVDGLARGLSKLARDAATRDAFAAAGHARAREFSWPVVTEQYVEAYEDARCAAGTGHPKSDASEMDRPAIRCAPDKAAAT
jgi:glycosyltransferase involved in cell wall biosynthesis